MNKYQRRKSRMIKAYIKWVREIHGTTISYKKARRQISSFRRRVRNVPTITKAIDKGLKRLRYWRNVKKIPLCDTLKPLCGTGPVGLRTNVMLVDEFEHYHPMGPAPKLPGDPNFVIDETPIEEPTEMWPKENPYLKKETYAEN